MSTIASAAAGPLYYLQSLLQSAGGGTAFSGVDPLSALMQSIEGSSGSGRYDYAGRFEQQQRQQR